MGNRSTYEAAQEDGLLYLPTGEHLRRLQRAQGGQTGDDPELYAEFKKDLEGATGAGREVILLWDEINLIGHIAFRIVKGKYQFFGLCDKPCAHLLYRDPKAKPQTLSSKLDSMKASHALVFMVCVSRAADHRRRTVSSRARHHAPSRAITRHHAHHASSRLTTPHHASSHLITPHLTSPHLISSHRISPHLTSSHLITPHLASSHLISPHHTSSHLITPHHTSPHLTTPHHASSRLITPHHTSSHLITPSSHLSDV